MASKNKLRVTLTVKLLVMFMVVTIISSLSIGMVSYKNAAKGLTQSVYTRLNAASIDVVSKVVEINKRQFIISCKSYLNICCDKCPWNGRTVTRVSSA